MSLEHPLTLPVRAAITAVHGYLPPDVLTNADLARQMLAKSGLAITAARDLTDAATKAVSLAGAHS